MLENSFLSIQWRVEDMARVKFRLSLVLKALGKSEDAVGIRDEALKMRKEFEDQLPDMAAPQSDQAEMELFDRTVCLWHGRTTGMWSDGENW